MKLNIKAFALATGLVWGLNWFGATWWMIILDGTSPNAFLVSKMYRGYTITPLGSLAGFLWGFIDGFLIGLLIALIYNKLAPRFQKKDE
jgi:hypothetical protein